MIRYAPSLQIVVTVEEKPAASIVAMNETDEFRLLFDLEARCELRRQLDDAIDDAIETMRERRAQWARWAA